MKIRAWSKDYKSVETFYVPTDCDLSWNFEDRLNDYKSDLERHKSQLENEYVGLALVSKKYGLPKDLFKLIKDKFLNRPIRHTKIRQSIGFKSYLFALLLILIFFGVLVCALELIRIGIVMFPLDLKERALECVWECTNTIMASCNYICE